MTQCTISSNIIQIRIFRLSNFSKHNIKFWIGLSGKCLQATQRPGKNWSTQVGLIWVILELILSFGTILTVWQTYLLVAEDANRLLYILEMVSISDIHAIPLPESPTKWALVPDNSNSAVGSCLVPNLSFSFTICMLLSWLHPGWRVST